MAEWLSYTPSDFLLFSARTYYRLFDLYNHAIWPGQILALMLGLVVLWRLHRGGARQGAVVTTILSAGWLWTAWSYLLEQYGTINWAARISPSASPLRDFCSSGRVPFAADSRFSRPGTGPARAGWRCSCLRSSDSR